MQKPERLFLYIYVRFIGFGWVFVSKTDFYRSRFAPFITRRADSADFRWKSSPIQPNKTQ